MVDNLMDLTHETYLHTTSIRQKEIDEAPVTTKTDGDMVITSRFMENIMAPPFWRTKLRGNNLADDVPVDRYPADPVTLARRPARTVPTGALT